MKRAGPAIRAAVAQGPDGAIPSRTMTLTGVVKTTKGYAVATATIEPTGEVVSICLGHSQTQKEFAASEHKRLLMNAASLA